MGLRLKWLLGLRVWRTHLIIFSPLQAVCSSLWLHQRKWRNAAALEQVWNEEFLEVHISGWNLIWCVNGWFFKALLHWFKSAFLLLHMCYTVIISPSPQCCGTPEFELYPKSTWGSSHLWNIWLHKRRQWSATRRSWVCPCPWNILKLDGLQLWSLHINGQDPGVLSLKLETYLKNTLKRLALAWSTQKNINWWCIRKDTPPARQFNPFARSLRRGQLLVHRGIHGGCTTEFDPTAGEYPPFCGDQSIEVSQLTQPLLEMANCSKSLSRPALAPDYLVQSSACELWLPHRILQEKKGSNILVPIPKRWTDFPGIHGQPGCWCSPDSEVTALRCQLCIAWPRRPISSRRVCLPVPGPPGPPGLIFELDEGTDYGKHGKQTRVSARFSFVSLKLNQWIWWIWDLGPILSSSSSNFFKIEVKAWPIASRPCCPWPIVMPGVLSMEHGWGRDGIRDTHQPLACSCVTVSANGNMQIYLIYPWNGYLNKENDDKPLDFGVANF